MLGVVQAGFGYEADLFLGCQRLTPTVEVVGLVLSLCDQLDGGCGRSMWMGRGEC